MVLILCEGPSCNDGKSALQHERDFGQTMRLAGEARAEAMKTIRARVTARLRYAVHDTYGSSARCMACGHVRIYG